MHELAYSNISKSKMFTPFFFWVLQTLVFTVVFYQVIFFLRKNLHLSNPCMLTWLSCNYACLLSLSICPPFPSHIRKQFSMVHFTVNVCLWLCTSLLGEAGLTVTSLSRLLIMQSTQIVQIELTEYKYYALSLCRVKASLKRNHSYASATACNINSSSSCQTNITKPSKPASFLCVVSGHSGKTTTQQQP